MNQADIKQTVPLIQSGESTEKNLNISKLMITSDGGINYEGDNQEIFEAALQQAAFYKQKIDKLEQDKLSTARNVDAMYIVFGSLMFLAFTFVIYTATASVFNLFSQPQVTEVSLNVRYK